MVYVISQGFKPLMPTSPSRARRLLRDKKAEVYKRTPFTIKLLYTPETEEVQPVALGVKGSYDNIKLSASTEKQELYVSETVLRTDIPNKLETRRNARRTRRNRLRYRPPRFNNRAIPKGWFAPSVREKLDAYIKVIDDAKELLPINKIVVEVASYDIRKLIDPEIKGKEYQCPIITLPENITQEKLEEIDFWNVREFVFARDNFKCRCCKKKTDPVLGIHHLKDYIHCDKPDYKKHYSIQNSITVCRTCHEKIHNGEIECKVKNRGFKAEAFANITKYEFVKQLRNKYPDEVFITFGYITKYRRIENDISSKNYGNIFAIAGNLQAKRTNEYFLQRKIRCHDRSIYNQKALKGGVYRKRQSPKFIGGFKMYDKVLYNGKECFVVGRIRSKDKNGEYSRNYLTLQSLDKKQKYASSARIETVKLLERGTTCPKERRPFVFGEEE